MGSTVRYAAVSSVGPRPLVGWVRALNPLGAAVPAPDATLVVGGVDTLVRFDAFGYGAVQIDDPGVVTVQGAGVPTPLYAIDTDWPGLDAYGAWALPLDAPERMVAAGDGLVVAQGSSLWWVGASQAPHEVLTAPEPIRGLRARRVDADRVVDVVLWTDNDVMLLRGRPGGGLAFGLALTAEGLRVGGADVGDVSGDRLPDLAVAWAGPDAGVVDVWEGDGGFDLVASAAWPVDGVPGDLSIGDARATGTAQITVLATAGDRWWRFAAGPAGGYAVVGPSLPRAGDLALSSFVPGGDTNADGGEEVVVVTPRGTTGDGWAALLFDLAGDPSVLDVSDDDVHQVLIADANDDQIDDVWAVDPSGELFAFTSRTSVGDRRRVDVLTLPGLGPVAVADDGDDGWPALSLTTPGMVRQWRGRGYANDPDRLWAPWGLARGFVRGEVAPAFSVVEADDDPSTIEVVIVTNEDADTRLKVIQYSQGGGRAPQLSSVRLLSNKEIPDDVRICGTQAWVLVGGRVHRVDIADPALPRLVGGFGDEVTRVDCTIDGTAAAWLELGTMHLALDGGAEQSTIDAPDSWDVAIGVGSDGPVIATCDRPGCSVVHVDDDGGAPRFAVSDTEGTRLVGDPPLLLGPIGGALTALDLDGNGHIDVMGVDADRGVWFVHRATGGSFGPAEVGFGASLPSGGLAAADGDGDGFLDLWYVDEIADLGFTPAPRPE